MEDPVLGVFLVLLISLVEFIKNDVIRINGFNPGPRKHTPKIDRGIADLLKPDVIDAADPALEIFIFKNHGPGTVVGKVRNVAIRREIIDYLGMMGIAKPKRL